MNKLSPYHGYRFPEAIISHAVWLYHRFTLSFRDVEERLAERGVIVSYETIRTWCKMFGPKYANRLRTREGCLGDPWFVGKVQIVTANGERLDLW